MARRLSLLLGVLVVALTPLPARAFDDPPGISFFYPLSTRRPHPQRAGVRVLAPGQPIFEPGVTA